MIVFGDLLLSSSAQNNAETLNFVSKTLDYYSNGGGTGNDWIDGVDLVVILGNVVNGTDWDGQDSNYFQDRWDMLMEVIIEYQVKVAFTLGHLDAKANIKDPYKIIEYINSYGNFSMTFPSPISIAGATFYGLPIRDILCDDKTKMLTAGYLLFLDSNTEECPTNDA